MYDAGYECWLEQRTNAFHRCASRFYDALDYWRQRFHKEFRESLEEPFYPDIARTNGTRWLAGLYVYRSYIPAFSVYCRSGIAVFCIAPVGKRGKSWQYISTCIKANDSSDYPGLDKLWPK